MNIQYAIFAVVLLAALITIFWLSHGLSEARRMWRQMERSWAEIAIKEKETRYRNEHLERRCESTRSANESLRESAKALDKNLSAANRRVAELEESFNAATRLADSNHAEYQKIVEMRAGDVAAHTDAIEKYEALAKKHEQQSKDLNFQITNYAKALENTQYALKHMTDWKDALLAENDRAKNDSALLKEDAKVEIDSLTSQLANLTMAYNEKMEESEHRAMRIAELEQVLGDRGTKIRELETTITSENAHTRHLESIIALRDKTVTDLQNQRAANEKFWVHNDEQQRRWLQERTEEVASLEKELTELKEKYEATKTDNISLLYSHATSDTEVIRRKDMRIKALEARITVISQRRGELAADARRLASDLATQISAKEGFKADLAKEVAASVVSANLIHDLRSEVSALRRGTAAKIAKEPLSDWERELLGKPLPEGVPVHYIFGQTYVHTDVLFEVQEKLNKAKAKAKKYKRSFDTIVMQ